MVVQMPQWISTPGLMKMAPFAPLFWKYQTGGGPPKPSTTTILPVTSTSLRGVKSKKSALRPAAKPSMRTHSPLTPSAGVLMLKAGVLARKERSPTTSDARTGTLKKSSGMCMVCGMPRALKRSAR